MQSDRPTLRLDPGAACANILHRARDGLSALQGAVGNVLQSLDGRKKVHHATDSTGTAVHSGPSPSSRDSSATIGASRAAPASHLEALRQPVLAPGPVTRENLGRSTWLLLHTLAAQYPERPTKQQRKDVAALIDTLTRIYPCGECAQHFQEIVRSNPPRTAHAGELQRWVCEVHNTVNRSLGKASFNCDLVQARWGALDCGDEMACDLNFRGRH